jgi:coenzyme F420-0:L-glutamate ligase/coenzyme F420-1:gamma-L-glutamate ligase
MEGENMQLFPIKTGLVKIGDNLVETVLKALEKQNLELENGDVLALSSKIVSYSQGRVVKLSGIKPSEGARRLAERYSLGLQFAELVLREADRIYGGVDRAVLTLKDGVLIANAGIDSKNAPAGFAVLWPKNIGEWVRCFRDEVIRRTGERVAVVVVDSGLIPLRVGTVGLALAVGGFKPVGECRGKKDLFGRSLVITRHAIGDDLASAAHLLMGEVAEKIPVVLIRGACLDHVDRVYGSEEMMMPLKECLFMGVLKS